MHLIHRMQISYGPIDQAYIAYEDTATINTIESYYVMAITIQQYGKCLDILQLLRQISKSNQDMRK